MISFIAYIVKEKFQWQSPVWCAAAKEEVSHKWIIFEEIWNHLFLQKDESQKFRQNRQKLAAEIRLR